jgi:putative ABC transport system permease protein
MIEGNLRRQLEEALPARAPAFFFVDIQSAEAAAFDAFIASHARGGEYERVPMLRGRIVAAGGRRAEDLRPSADAAWVLQGDRGITYSRDVPAGSKLVAGSWWAPDYDGPPLVSLERRIAEGLGLAIGDTIEVNVLGRTVTARIANLRHVDWQSLGINFVLVFSPNTFRGAPHAFIATLALAGGGTAVQEGALVRALAAQFPTVTAVRVKEALEALAALAGNLVLGIRGASLVAIVAAVLVLGGALASGHRQRVYDAVILRTLGATRRRILGAYALEYGMLGAATVVFGLAAGSLAAALVVVHLMKFSFVWLPGSAIGAALFALVVTLGFGLAGTFAALGQKPAPVLRNL